MTEANTEPTKPAVITKNKLIIIVALIIAMSVMGTLALTGRLTLVNPESPFKTPNTPNAPSVSEQTLDSCPFECCVNDARYQVHVCQGSNFQCVNNQCIKTNCPYECCPEGDFSAKGCQPDFQCQNGICVAIDSDKDGLTDIEERLQNTNPNLYDSDGDTLSDYQEIRVLGTNPMNINTDNDRYNDNLDPNPNTKNSALMDISITNEDFGIDYVSIGIAFLGGGVINPDMAIARPTVTLRVANNGNDYTSYLNYDVVFFIAKTETKRFPVQKDKIEANYQSTDTQSYELKAKDIPTILINLITKQSTEWDVQIQNIRYEKF